MATDKGPAEPFNNQARSSPICLPIRASSCQVRSADRLTHMTGSADPHIIQTRPNQQALSPLVIPDQVVPGKQSHQSSVTSLASRSRPNRVHTSITSHEARFTSYDSRILGGPPPRDVRHQCHPYHMDRHVLTQAFPSARLRPHPAPRRTAKSPGTGSTAPGDGPPRQQTAPRRQRRRGSSILMAHSATLNKPPPSPDGFAL